MVLDVNGEGVMTLMVSDRKNDTSNSFSVEVGEGATPNQKFYFKVENLKLLSGDYEVKVSSKGISNFKNVSKDIQYFIALETA
jgi:ABC-type antimicrobial peptide transport system permease subunit